ncbi:organoarsenical effux MFS transporter ArsJ [Methylophaga sp. OBS4]|uniref:organoarsenical effux MFS transporter ArsJ n=1 Tax=Methylophaga sp. OBS4 TaxID=2991935 RepID=UPI00224FF3E7|nr:organoarsenical effux MFS transporter ArsJ [Methylophaga sp. OBS4]MCX4186926.1 organoarsenical effux MFS transporter ArsJ [Methylophaga sp. OBS4]
MSLEQGLRHYLIVTGGYWAFTLTDGAIRMLVVLYFHLLGYTPFEVAMLFLFYEIFGIVTNLVGGWLGSRIGLNLTMHIGMGMQVVALSMLMVPDAWLSVAYVMFAQALSGIAKDLNKMSAKASIKTLLPAYGSESRLFKWIAVLTGSKNALKGVGFFVGAMLLQTLGFRGALAVLAAGLFVVMLITMTLLPSQLGKSKSKPKFAQVFSKTPAINWLSAARFFLFGARDVWFVVALPVYLYSVFDWSFMEVGGFLALWVIGYGLVQACAPRLIRHSHHGKGPDGNTARFWVFTLAFLPVLIALGLHLELQPQLLLITGLIIFGVVFAINSALHSYLIVAWSERDKVSMNVGFYYMANAGGRLAGTVLSGLIYQTQGLIGCLIWSGIFVVAAGVLSLRLPPASIIGVGR